MWGKSLIDMRQRVLSAALATALAAGSAAPALANGTASTRNIVASGVIAGFFITDYFKRLKQKKKEHEETIRREQAYRDWFYHKYGYYPTYQQFKQWYVQTYGSAPD
jgi:hypothetical protein